MGKIGNTTGRTRKKMLDVFAGAAVLTNVNSNTTTQHVTLTERQICAHTGD